MKIKMGFIILLFFPAIVYAQVDYEYLRDSEINRTLALMEAEAEYTSYYENAYATAEETPITAQDIYAAQAQEAQTTTPKTSMPTEEWQYTNTGEIPPPPIELPPPENKFKRDLTARIKSIFGERTYGTFGMNTGFLKGFTRYHISFDNPNAIGGHGESELVWPLRNGLIGVGGALHYRTANSSEEDPRDMIRLGLQWHTRLKKNAGYLRDSDWIENDIGFIDWQDDGLVNGSDPWAWNHDGKDIYSETAADLDHGNILDANCIYNFWPIKNWGIGPMIGYRYQRFAFSAYSVKQIGYGPYDDPRFDMNYTDTEGLKWIEYGARYGIPYLGLNSELIWNKFSLLCTFGYSNWVKIKDQDTHLYPTTDRDWGINIDMVSRGHTRGQAFLFGFNGGWKFWPDWLLSLGATYLNIYASGTTTQNTYLGGDLVGVSDPITEKVTSRCWLTSASIQYVF